MESQKKVNEIAKKVINEFPSWNELLNHALEVDKNFYNLIVRNSILYQKTEIDSIIPEFYDLIDITNHIGRAMVGSDTFNDWRNIKIDKKTKLPTKESWAIAVDAAGRSHVVNGYEFIALIKIYLTTWLRHPKYDSKLNKLRMDFSYSTEKLSRITN